VIVAISGSLRRSSVNSAAIRAAAGWAGRHGIEFMIDDHLSILPVFNPDTEAEAPPAVEAFRKVLELADERVGAAAHVTQLTDRFSIPV